MRIEPIDDGNRAECLSLDVDESQRGFIATNQRSLEQADVNPHDTPMLIRRDGIAVGFLMYERRGPTMAALHRLMVDCRFQRQGIGMGVMQQLITRLQAEGVETIYLSFRPENAAARKLYDRLGFVEQEIKSDGEVLYRLGPASSLD